MKNIVWIVKYYICSGLTLEMYISIFSLECLKIVFFFFAVKRTL